tara:strand:+ start:6003 stop:6848 length:846 start_codon:yes stop_codon:yes gene_type:complete
MARMLGKGTVLPDLPYTADMPSFDEVSLTRDTLPAHNARELITQGLTQVGPRPAAPVINMPQIAIPESKPMSEYETLMGGGYGQGIVPNGPRPAPTPVSAPAISLDQSYLSQDYNLADYDLTWDGLSPEGQYLRPTSPLELYNFDSGPDVSQLERVKPEKLMGQINAHQPQANTGGDPVFEAEAVGIRPTNPRQFFKAGPEVVVPVTPQQIPVRELPVMPASTQPKIPNVSKLVGPVKPIKVEAQYVAPPIRGADMGGMLNSTSKVGGVANFNGRTVGMSK